MHVDPITTKIHVYAHHTHEHLGANETPIKILTGVSASAFVRERLVNICNMVKSSQHLASD